MRPLTQKNSFSSTIKKLPRTKLNNKNCLKILILQRTDSLLVIRNIDLETRNANICVDVFKTCGQLFQARISKKTAEQKFAGANNVSSSKQ
jgi:hypothetical protein